MLPSLFHLKFKLHFLKKLMRLRNKLCIALGILRNTYCVKKENPKEPLYCLVNKEFSLSRRTEFSSPQSSCVGRSRHSTDGRKLFNTNLLALVEIHWVYCTVSVNVAGSFLAAYFAQVNTWDKDDLEKCHSSRKLDKNWDTTFPIAIPSTLSTYKTPRITASLCGL